MSTPDIAAVMAAAMGAEDRRRELAGQSPGLGALVQLPQPPSGPGVGLSDVDLPVVGESYGPGAPGQPAQHKAYGEARPVYADPLVSGLGYDPGAIASPALRHVTNLGADGLLIEPYADGRQSGDPYTVISPPAARPSLWQRLAGRLRRH